MRVVQVFDTNQKTQVQNIQIELQRVLDQINDLINSKPMISRQWFKKSANLTSIISQILNNNLTVTKQTYQKWNRIDNQLKAMDLKSLTPRKRFGGFTSQSRQNLSTAIQQLQQSINSQIAAYNKSHPLPPEHLSAFDLRQQQLHLMATPEKKLTDPFLVHSDVPNQSRLFKTIQDKVDTEGPTSSLSNAMGHVFGDPITRHTVYEGGDIPKFMKFLSQSLKKYGANITSNQPLLEQLTRGIDHGVDVISYDGTTTIEEKIYNFATKLSTRLEGLPVEGSIILPLGWTSGDGNSGHGTVIEIIKEADTTFTVQHYNLGDGADVYQDRRFIHDKKRCHIQPVIEIKGVQKSKLINPYFSRAYIELSTNFKDPQGFGPMELHGLLLFLGFDPHASAARPESHDVSKYLPPQHSGTCAWTSLRALCDFKFSREESAKLYLYVGLDLLYQFKKQNIDQIDSPKMADLDIFKLYLEQYFREIHQFKDCYSADELNAVALLQSWREEIATKISQSKFSIHCVDPNQTISPMSISRDRLFPMDLTRGCREKDTHVDLPKLIEFPTFQSVDEINTYLTQVLASCSTIKRNDNSIKGLHQLLLFASQAILHLPKPDSFNFADLNIETLTTLAEEMTRCSADLASKHLNHTQQIDVALAQYSIMALTLTSIQQRSSIMANSEDNDIFMAWFNSLRVDFSLKKLFLFGRNTKPIGDYGVYSIEQYQHFQYLQHFFSQFNQPRQRSWYFNSLIDLKVNEDNLYNAQNRRDPYIAMVHHFNPTASVNKNIQILAEAMAATETPPTTDPREPFMPTEVRQLLTQTIAANYCTYCQKRNGYSSLYNRVYLSANRTSTYSSRSGEYILEPTFSVDKHNKETHVYWGKIKHPDIESTLKLRQVNVGKSRESLTHNNYFLQKTGKTQYYPGMDDLGLKRAPTHQLSDSKIMALSQLMSHYSEDSRNNGIIHLTNLMAYFTNHSYELLEGSLQDQFQELFKILCCSNELNKENLDAFQNLGTEIKKFLLSMLEKSLKQERYLSACFFIKMMIFVEPRLKLSDITVSFDIVDKINHCLSLSLTDNETALLHQLKAAYYGQYPKYLLTQPEITAILESINKSKSHAIDKKHVDSTIEFLAEAALLHHASGISKEFEDESFRTTCLNTVSGHSNGQWNVGVNTSTYADTNNPSISFSLLDGQIRVAGGTKGVPEDLLEDDVFLRIFPKSEHKKLHIETTSDGYLGLPAGFKINYGNSSFLLFSKNYQTNHYTARLLYNNPPYKNEPYELVPLSTSERFFKNQDNSSSPSDDFHCASHRLASEMLVFVKVSAHFILNLTNQGYPLRFDPNDREKFPNPYNNDALLFIDPKNQQCYASADMASAQGSDNQAIKVSNIIRYDKKTLLEIKESNLEFLTRIENPYYIECWGQNGCCDTIEFLRYDGLTFKYDATHQRYQCVFPESLSEYHIDPNQYARGWEGFEDYLKLTNENKTLILVPCRRLDPTKHQLMTEYSGPTEALGLVKTTAVSKADKLKNELMPAYLCYEEDKEESRLHALYKIYIFYGMEDYKRAFDLIQETMTLPHQFSEQELELMSWIISLFSSNPESIRQVHKLNGNPAASSVFLRLSINLLTMYHQHLDQLKTFKPRNQQRNHWFSKSFNLYTFIQDNLWSEYFNYLTLAEPRQCLTLSEEEERAVIAECLQIQEDTETVLPFEIKQEALRIGMLLNDTPQPSDEGDDIPIPDPPVIDTKDMKEWVKNELYSSRNDCYSLGSRDQNDFELFRPSARKILWAYKNLKSNDKKERQDACDWFDLFKNANPDMIKGSFWITILRYVKDYPSKFMAAERLTDGFWNIKHPEFSRRDIHVVSELNESIRRCHDDHPELNQPPSRLSRPIALDNAEQHMEPAESKSLVLPKKPPNPILPKALITEFATTYTDVSFIEPSRPSTKDLSSEDEETERHLKELTADMQAFGENQSKIFKDLNARLAKLATKESPLSKKPVTDLSSIDKKHRLKFLLSQAMRMNKYKRNLFIKLEQTCTVTKNDYNKQKEMFAAKACHLANHPTLSSLEEIKYSGELRPNIRIQDLTLAFIQQNTQAYQTLNPQLSKDDCQQLHDLMFEYLQASRSYHQLTRLEISFVELEKDVDMTNSGDIKTVQDLVLTVLDDLNIVIQVGDDLERGFKNGDLVIRERYDLKEHPEFMVFEHLTGMALRQSQIDNLKKLYGDPENPDNQLILQMIMGSGKTKLLLPLLAFKKANGTNLSMLVVPESLEKDVVANLHDLSNRIFGQHTHTISFDRNTACKKSDLDKIVDVLQRVKKYKHFLIVTSKTLHCLRLKFLECLHKYQLTQSAVDLESAQGLQQILSILYHDGNPIFDEVDTILDCKHEVNFTLGESDHPDKSELSFLVKLHRIVTNIIKDKKPNKVNFKSIVQDAIFKALANNTSCLGDDFRGCLEQAKEKNSWESIKKFLSEKGTLDMTNLSDLNQSLLYLLRQELSELLPLTYSKELNVDYGQLPSQKKSVKDKMVAIPYIKSSPKQDSRFDQIHELLNYTVQMYMEMGIPDWILYKYLRSLQEDVKAEESRGCPFENTDTVKAFRRLFKQKISPECLHGDNFTACIEEIKLFFKENIDALDTYISDYILLFIQTNLQTLNSNSYDLVSLFKHGVQGFSGTPHNWETYHWRSKTEMEKGSDGKSLAIVLSNAADIQALDEHHCASAQSIVETLKFTEKTRAFIDVGALFKGSSNRDVATWLLKKCREDNCPKDIEGIVYYEDNEQVFMDIHGRVIPFEFCKVPSENRLTYYDQSHSTGSDIKQSKEAEAITSIGVNTKTRDLFQGIWRMRDILKSQCLCFVLSPEVREILGAQLTIPAIIEFVAKNQSKQRYDDVIQSCSTQFSHPKKEQDFLSLITTPIENIHPSIVEKLIRKKSLRPNIMYAETKKEVKREDLIAQFKELALVHTSDSEHSLDCIQKMYEASLPEILEYPSHIGGKEHEAEVQIEAEKEKEIEKEVKANHFNRYSVPTMTFFNDYTLFYQSIDGKPSVLSTYESFNQAQSMKKMVNLQNQNGKTFFSPNLHITQNLMADVLRERAWSQATESVATSAEEIKESCLKGEFQEPCQYILVLQLPENPDKTIFMLHENEVLAISEALKLFNRTHRQTNGTYDYSPEINPNFAIYDIERGCQYHHNPFNDDPSSDWYKDDPEFKKSVVQIKFFNGKLFYDDDELAILKEWLGQFNKEEIRYLLEDDILKHMPMQKQRYKYSPLYNLLN